MKFQSQKLQHQNYSVCEDAVNNVLRPMDGSVFTPCYCTLVSKYYCLENKVSENRLHTQSVLYLIIIVKKNLWQTCLQAFKMHTSQYVANGVCINTHKLMMSFPAASVCIAPVSFLKYTTYSSNTVVSPMTTKIIGGTVINETADTNSTIKLQQIPYTSSDHHQ